jgi:hypothetical protein
MLSEIQLADVHEFLNKEPMLTASGSQLQKEELSERPQSAHYSLNTVLRCPNILALANSPSVIRIVTDYLGCKPTISQIGLRWTFPSSDSALDFTHQLHRDYDDWRFVKLFVYLTDVDAASGPHVFVAESHCTSGRFRCSSYYSRQDVERSFGQANIKSLLGPGGSGFFADTFGIHKGEVPLSRPRLLLGIEYSLLPNYSLVYKPTAVPGAAVFDPYINRLLIAQTS